MQYKLKTQPEKPKPFEPVTLEIVIESEEEGRALFAVFNHSDNSDLLRHPVHSVLQRFSNVHDGWITRWVSYRDWYCGTR